MKIEKFEPILGPLINKPYTELLHNTNNAFQHIYAQLLKEAEKKSDFPSNIKLGESHKDCIIRILTYTLRSIKATHFFKKVRKCVNSGCKKSFHHKFTDKGSKLLSNHFMKLILSLHADDDDDLFKLSYMSLLTLVCNSEKLYRFILGSIHWIRIILIV